MDTVSAWIQRACQMEWHQWVGMSGRSTWLVPVKQTEAEPDVKALKPNTHESLFCQHKTEPLLHAVWSDNNIVKTLSNFHSPVIEVGGILRKQKDDDGDREREQTPADVPEQQKEYCENFHWIDKGNANEAKCKLDYESKTHGWAPKVACRLFNMTMNNAFKMYEYFCVEEDQMPSDMAHCVRELATSLLNEGPPMRRRKAGNPPTLTPVDSPQGRKV